MLKKGEMLRTGLRGFLSYIVIAAVLCALAPAVVLFLPAMPVFADSSVPYTGQKASGNYTISTAAQLGELARIVNLTPSDNFTYPNSYFTVTADIDLSESDNYTTESCNLTWPQPGGTCAWAPIGGNCTISSYVPTGNYFAGIFDGDNHSISGISISNGVSGWGAYGLFGYVNGGTLANLTVAGTLNMGDDDPMYEIGGVVGHIAGNLYNLHSSMTVYVGDPTEESTSMTGGIAGVVRTTSTGPVRYVQYCSNSGDVTGRDRVGGIVGAAYCYYKQGGVVVDQCYNTGKVTSVYSSRKIFSGGIVGYNMGYISNCYNRGDVETNNGHYLGGVAGILNAMFGVKARLDNCYSTANFTGSYNPGYDHALWAYADESSSVNITNSFYVEINPAIYQPTTTDYGTCTNVAEVTAEQLAGHVTMSSPLSGYIIGYLGGEFGYKAGDEYPVLDWQQTPDFTMTGLSSGAPSGSGTDSDDLTAIFLDGAASTNGTGTKSSPFNNFASAEAVLSSSNNTIYITGQVTVNDTDVWNFSGITGARLMRSCTYDGYLVEVTSGGNLTLQNIILDGNSGNVTISSGSLINSEGGYLTVGENTILRNNYANTGGAIRIENSGNVTMTGGTITGNSAVNYGDGVYLLGGTFNIIAPTSTGTFDLHDQIYLDNGRIINIDENSAGTLGNISETLTVKVADPATDREVAYCYSGFDTMNDLNMFTCANPDSVNPDWYFDFDGTGTEIVMQPKL